MNAFYFNFSVSFCRKAPILASVYGTKSKLRYNFFFGYIITTGYRGDYSIFVGRTPCMYLDSTF